MPKRCMLTPEHKCYDLRFLEAKCAFCGWGITNENCPHFEPGGGAELIVSPTSTEAPYVCHRACRLSEQSKVVAGQLVKVSFDVPTAHDRRSHVMSENKWLLDLVRQDSVHEVDLGVFCHHDAKSTPVTITFGSGTRFAPSLSRMRNLCTTQVKVRVQLGTLDWARPTDSILGNLTQNIDELVAAMGRMAATETSVAFSQLISPVHLEKQTVTFDIVTLHHFPGSEGHKRYKDRIQAWSSNLETCLTMFMEEYGHPTALARAGIDTVSTISYWNETDTVGYRNCKKVRINSGHLGKCHPIVVLPSKSPPAPAHVLVLDKEMECVRVNALSQTPFMISAKCKESFLQVIADLEQKAGGREDQILEPHSSFLIK